MAQPGDRLTPVSTDCPVLALKVSCAEFLSPGQTETAGHHKAVVLSEARAEGEGAGFVPQGRLAKSGNIFGCHDWEVGGGSGMPPNILQCTGQSPRRSIIWPQLLTVARLRNPTGTEVNEVTATFSSTPQVFLGPSRPGKKAPQA